MKSTENFKKVIESHLNELAAKDEVFAGKMKAEGKSINDCVTYILNTVKKSGCNGFTDAEIFGMAIHYYDEKDIIKGLKFAKRMNEFVSYVYDFYGKNGIYDMGATVSQIQTATIHYIGSDDSLPFYGDSLDRERVRDILTSKFNLKEVK